MENDYQPQIKNKTNEKSIASETLLSMYQKGINDVARYTRQSVPPDTISRIVMRNHFHLPFIRGSPGSCGSFEYKSKQLKFFLNAHAVGDSDNTWQSTFYHELGHGIHYQWDPSAVGNNDAHHNTPTEAMAEWLATIMEQNGDPDKVKKTLGSYIPEFRDTDPAPTLTDKMPFGSYLDLSSHSNPDVHSIFKNAAYLEYMFKTTGSMHMVLDILNHVPHPIMGKYIFVPKTAVWTYEEWKENQSNAAGGNFYHAVETRMLDFDNYLQNTWSRSLSGIMRDAHDWYYPKYT